MMVFDKDYIDLDSALARVRNNKTLFAKMLKLFLASAEFQSLEDSLAACDYSKASEIAHTIKGMTGNLSLNAVYTLSAELMAQLRQGPPDEATLNSYRDAYKKTRADVEQIIIAIEADTL